MSVRAGHVSMAAGVRTVSMDTFVTVDQDTPALTVRQVSTLLALTG